MDDSQKISDNTIPVQTAEAPSSPVSSPLTSSTPAVDSIPKSVFRKHTSPLSFKSVSVIILVLLLGSVFAVSQLSSKKDSMDVRSRASKKEDKNMLQNGSFERDLLNWKQSKKSNDVTIAIATDKKSQGTKSVKIVNAGGSDAYVYQDVKVEPGTWYTIRADAFKSAGNGEVKVEVTEYDMVGGKPKFNPKKLSSRVYTGTDFQTRPMIFKTGKAEVALAPQNVSFISKAFAATCGASGTYNQCGSAGGCGSGERCIFAGSDTTGDYYKCKTDTNCPTSTPTPAYTCSSLKSGQCGLPACPNGFKCVKSAPDSTSYGCYESCVVSTSTPTPTGCNQAKAGQCGPAGGCLENQECASSGERGQIIYYCKSGCSSTTTPTKTPTPTRRPSRDGTRDTTTPPPAPPSRNSGCQSDDECKAKPDQYCDASGACKDRPPNCGSICFQKGVDPKDIKDSVMQDRCGGSDISMVCAANSPDGNRYCWSDAGCGGGGGQGGGGKADKYVRVLLHMNKSGTAYFDNVRFEKGRVNTAVKITSTAPTEATVGEELEYQLVASDAERDFLTYGLGNAPCPIGKPKCKKNAPPTPSGATITQTGLFTFTPTESGTANIRLWATDGLLPGIQNLQLIVSP